MSGGMPELGSKISLISKADIRYEGELYTVDPIECTIALSNVRSFGTEDREAQCPVPAQAQVYEFILFRGSDIKDIRVVQGQPMPPNDPAIVQHQISHAPPSAAPGYHGVVQPSHSFSHHMGAAPGSHLMGGSLGGAHPHGVHPSVTGGGGGYNPMSGMPFSREPHKSMPVAGLSHEAPGPLAPRPLPPPQPNHQPPHQPPHQPGPSDLIGSLSRSSTPAPRKSPSLDHLAGGGARLGPGQRAVQRPGSRQSRSRERMYNNEGNASSQQPALTYRDRNDFYDRSEMRQEYGVGPSRDNYRGDTRRDQQRDHRAYNNYRSGGGAPRGGGGWHGGNNLQRSNSGGRRPVRPRSRGPGFGPNNPGGYNRGGKGGNTLKFESDYDFDKANSEFNEMLNKLNETKLEDGGVPVVVNGSAAEEKTKEDGGDLGDHDAEADDDKFYDKTKSFFDNISCEAVERSKGAFQRTDWRQERKMNSETFGVAATRRGGGYRGRGGFYYGGGGRGYNHHRNHYNHQGRSNRGGYGPRLGGGSNPRHSYINAASNGPSTIKDVSSNNGPVSNGPAPAKTAAQVVASKSAVPPTQATEAK